MTRRTVYAAGLILTLACKQKNMSRRHKLHETDCILGTIMTIASISMPRWVTYSPNGEREYSYGLHTRCSAVTGTCVPFPKSSDCAKDPSFCNMWRTVGFLTSFGVVVELCALVSFIVIISGGVQRRAAGWQVAVGVLSFSAIVQCAGMAIVVRYFPWPSAAAFIDGRSNANISRLTSSNTTSASGRAGISTSPGLYAPPAGSFLSWPRLGSPRPPSTSPSRATTSSFPRTTTVPQTTGERHHFRLPSRMRISTAVANQKNRFNCGLGSFRASQPGTTVSRVPIQECSTAISGIRTA